MRCVGNRLAWRVQASGRSKTWPPFGEGELERRPAGGWGCGQARKREARGSLLP